MKTCESKIMYEKEYKDNLLFPGRNSLIAFKEVRQELVGAKMELHHADLMIEWLNCELEKFQCRPFYIAHIKYLDTELALRPGKIIPLEPSGIWKTPKSER